MRVIFLLVLFLHILICACDNGQNVDNKQQTNNATDTKSNKELIRKKMRHSLLYIQPSERAVVLTKCGGGYNCTQGDISSNQWLPGTTDAAKNRFWHTYSCFKSEDIKACPVDGVWGVWSAWSNCTAKCGEERNMTRFRLCDNPSPVNGGLSCSGYSNMSTVCKGNCHSGNQVDKMGSFMKAWAGLSTIHTTHPKLTSLCLKSHCLYSQVVEVLGDKHAMRYWSNLHCYKYKTACPVDGGWTSWSAWSDCEPKCGSGKQWRIRNCTKPTPANNGFICRGFYYEENPCIGRNCSKTDLLLGALSEWTSPGRCSVSCGHYGVRERRRVCLANNSCADVQGRRFTRIVMKIPCYNGPCPFTTYGVWSSWSSYTQCSAACGKGRQLRIRLCDGLHYSRACMGQSLNVTFCENKCEEKNLTLTNETIGDAAQSFLPVHTKAPKGRIIDLNNPYRYELEAERIGSFTPWSNWSSCSKTCETGQRSRYRNCTVAGQCSGEIRQFLFCSTHKCPVNGRYSEWLSWSPCTVTCGNGLKVRYRTCDKPLPQNGGTCFGKWSETVRCSPGKCRGPQFRFAHWTQWSRCSKLCGMGSRVRTRYCKLHIREHGLNPRYWQAIRRGLPICRAQGKNKFTGVCNQRPCSVAGDWANWSSWSKCSRSCGVGVHYRDRTCTDPAPLYWGAPCKGAGSEAIPCFHGPCLDRQDTGVRLNGSSGLLYSPFDKPQSYLSVHLVLKPLRPNGIIMYRSQSCQIIKCRHSVKLSLFTGKPHVEVIHRGSKMTVTSNTPLEMKDWNTVYVYLSQHHGFLRVNNGPHLRAKYHPKPSHPINYDSGMTLGADTNKGFVGVIAEAKVNYQTLSLQRMAGWGGYGMPEDEWSTQAVDVDPVTKYPKFKGDTFLKLSIQDLETMYVQMSIWPEKLEGLLLFNKGRLPGTFAYLMIHKGVFRYCLNCGRQPVCADIQDAEAKRWYHVSIFVSGLMSTVRINLGKATQITSPGLPYHTGSTLYVGGGERHDWTIFSTITGTDRGFTGSFHDITVNGHSYRLMDSPLVDNKGFMNTEGVGSTEKVMDVLEQTDNEVVLRCDFSGYVHSGSEVYVEWFHVDKKIKSGPGQKIIPKLPGDSYLGSLTLSAKHHGSGLYVCMVNYDGQLANHIAFVLTKDSIEHVHTAVMVEVTGVQTFLIVMAVFAALVLMCSTYKICQLAREDRIRPILQKLKEIRKRTAGIKISPPGVEDLDKAELVPIENAGETEGDSSVDMKDTQEKVSVSSEPGDIEVNLQGSSNSDDDGDDVQEEVTTRQSIHDHPSRHGTSGEAAHQQSLTTHGARESSASLHGTQILGDEIPKKSLVVLPGSHGSAIHEKTFHRTQSAKDHISSENIPRRSSVYIRGSKENIDNDRIPRRSSVSIRENFTGYDIPRRSSVSLRGTPSTRVGGTTDAQSYEHPPPPQLSWTHRSTQEITQGPSRTGISVNQYRQSSSVLEKQLSNTLPPAGSPSPPRSPQRRTSPSRLQPDLAITVSANRSSMERLGHQSSVPSLPPALPQPPSQRLVTDVITQQNEGSQSDTTTTDTGTDSDTSKSESFPPLPPSPPSD
ncbi:uncharacterized protein [Argopecten irradians]|uniref:uncharacterized protein isoform X2 n=1 Tax=Argopecten irradians TaxID=31199 RepID=UPI003714C0EF